jgi:hypothetical protein
MIMKLGKPVYAKESQTYVCECKDEEHIFRVESYLEGGKWSVPLDSHIEKTREDMISFLLTETTGWFSKPLTKEWLLSRLHYTIPTSDIPVEFEGMCRWTFAKLYISKESFICEFVLSEKVAHKLPLIDLQEDVVAEVAVVAEDSKYSPTREERKSSVLLARRRAAMALLKAERMMQAYAGEFGENTDWEDEDDE